MSMLARGRRRWTVATILAVLALSAAAVLPFHPPFRTVEPLGALEATVSSDARGIFHVYFDLGRGINEPDSRFIGIPGDGRLRRVHIPLPLGEYRSLRLDPVDRGGTLTLSDVRVVDDAGQTVRTFAPSDFTAVHQIRELRTEGSTLHIVGEESANYLSLSVKQDRTFVIAASRRGPWLGYLVAVALVAAVGLIAIAVSPGNFTALLSSARRRPRVAMGVVAVAAVLCNSFPVVFLGRSYVSPNNGVALLYETLPNVPGYDSAEGADQKGSDVGAMMWWHLPASAVERWAMLHDHELPLWDRYDLCGQPLLGQGQSMLGDPLHWATILLGGGSSAAWDVKYLAAKMLLAWGIGLAVLELTGAWGIAALSAAASIFLGFFAFRENHPAFFSLCYSPWILVAWLRIAAAAQGRWWPAVALLVVADCAEINSGTVKEAYIMVMGLNLAGALVVGFGAEAPGLRWRRLAAACWGSLVCLLICAPFWLVFLDTLRVSLSSYERPRAEQLPWSRAIGLFDDLFYRQAIPAEGQVAPSANVLVLLGLLWALAAGWGRPGCRTALALAAAAAGPFAIAFTIVPEALIIKVPFLRNIVHVDSTFSCVVIVLALPIAGWGWRQAWECARGPSWVSRNAWVAGAVLVLLAVYFGVHPPASFSRFFRWYAAMLAIGAVVVTLAVRRLAARPSIAGSVALALGCGLLLWRHGQYVGHAFDGYVFHPQARAPMDADSPVLDYTASHQHAPGRTVGMGLNLFPGYNQLRLTEGIYGIEALRSREYVYLANAMGLGRVVNFTSRDPNDASAAIRPVYDALNVEYVLGNFQPLEAGNLNWDHAANLDLSVYRSRTFWPRAFFVSHLGSYGDVAQLAVRIKGAPGPFAAVQDGDGDISPDAQALIGASDATPAVAATNYQFSSNRTGFEIQAPGPGVAVLLESWFPEDFRATVDGREVPYFRVNHAFKGIYLGAAGTYRVAFSYWPRHLSLALGLAAVGLLLAAATGPGARRLGW